MSVSSNTSRADTAPSVASNVRGGIFRNSHARISSVSAAFAAFFSRSRTRSLTGRA
jgi:hypothetical protein